MVSIDFVIEVFDKLFSLNEAYYRCKVIGKDNLGTKTMFYEKVCKINEELSFSDKELRDLFDSNRYDTNVIHQIVEEE